jgi:Tfp pilus assembly protein PilF
MVLMDQNAIKIQKSKPRRYFNATTAEAYHAFRAGDYRRAEAGYREVLSLNPENRDALLGLAAIAVRRGDMRGAANYYNEVLNIHPKDSIASAALANLQTAGASVSESQLKLMLDQNPKAPHIFFSLGNKYAREQRWPEAQEAYFNAYSHDKKNPDYAYNLAVSLDRLGQNKTALEYYRVALDMAGSQPVNFDTAPILTRIRTLNGQAGSN